MYALSQYRHCESKARVWDKMRLLSGSLRSLASYFHAVVYVLIGMTTILFSMVCNNFVWN